MGRVHGKMELNLDLDVWLDLESEEGGKACEIRGGMRLNYSIFFKFIFFKPFFFDCA